MTRPLNYTSKIARSRIERILQIARRNPVCSLDISTEVYISENTAREYLTHLKNSGALIEDRTVKRTIYFKATGVYHPELLQIDGETPVRAAPYVKPFRCEWTTLFFGPATESHQQPESRA